MLRCAITPGRMPGGASRDAMETYALQCAGAAAKGVDWILLREKQLEAGELARLARRVVELAGGTAQVLVAGRADVALAAGAAGVHLGGSRDELTPEEVRCVLPRAWVSVACHRVEEVRRARESGASSVLFAPVFGKVVEGLAVVPGCGLALLGEACAAAGAMPVLALGSVTEDNAGACVGVGAAGIAGIRLFFGD